MDKNNILYKDVRDKSIKSIIWSYGYTILPQITQPLLMLIVGRFVDPSAFGLLAIGLLVNAFGDMIREAGLSQAFIQSDEDEKTIFNVVFWLSLCVGIFFYAFIFFGASLIATFFKAKESALVIKVLGLGIIFSSLSTSHRGLLIRKLNFKKLFVLNLIPNFVLFVVSVSLAYYGMGVWSLIIGYLSFSFTRTSVFWLSFSNYPNFNIDWKIFKKISYFGFLCSQESLLGWIYAWGDKAILGHILDMKQLGLYTVASTIVSSVFTLTFSPVTNISYPFLCRIKNDIERFRQFIYRSVQIMGFASFPLGIILFFSAPIIPLVFGQKWNGIEKPLQILSIWSSIVWIVSIVIPNGFRAIDRPDIMPKLQALKLIYTLPCLVLGTLYGGLIGFCYAKLINGIIGFFIFIIFSVNILGISYSKLFNSLKLIFFSSVLMACAIYFGNIWMAGLGWNTIVSMCLLLSTCLFLYVGIFYISNDKLPKEVINIFVQIARSKFNT